MSQMAVFGTNGNFFIWLLWGTLNPSNFPLNVLNVPFRLTGIHFDHYKNKIQFFNFVPFPSQVTWGLKTHFKSFEREYLFKRGQVEHVLTMAILKLKPSLFSPRPIVRECLLQKARTHFRNTTCKCCTG